MESKTLKNTRQGSLPGNGSDGSIVAIKHPSPGSFIMGRRIEYKKGEKIGHCIYINELPIGHSRRALFRCMRCGNDFECYISAVKSGNTKSCGCLHNERLKTNNLKHGLRKHPLYSRWLDIKKRCYNKNCATYKSYGGRGIIMYKLWVNDFMAFYNYMRTLPHFMAEGMEIDRIDTNKGYVPGNLRWSDHHTQNANQKKRNDNKTGFRGVSIYGDRFKAIIQVNGITHKLGIYNTAVEANNARQQFIIDNNLNEYSQ